MRGYTLFCPSTEGVKWWGVTLLVVDVFLLTRLSLGLSSLFTVCLESHKCHSYSITSLAGMREWENAPCLQTFDKSIVTFPSLWQAVTQCFDLSPQ